MYCISHIVFFFKNQRGMNAGRLRGKHYTICNEASCEGCLRIKAKEYDIRDGERKDMGTQPVSLSINKYHVKEKLDAHSH